MNIVIVEDNETLMENLRLLLQGEPGCIVIGAWRSSEEALESAPWKKSDILLSDLDLPGMSGVELIAEVKAMHPNVGCMAYTVCEDRDTVFAAIKAGACGYLLKGSTPRELIEALRNLHDGGAPMSPRIARKVIHHFQVQNNPDAVAEEGLTTRERDVLLRLERGQSYKEVGQALSISAHTVHAHIKRIYEKLQTRSRVEVVRKARQRGWI